MEIPENLNGHRRALRSTSLLGFSGVPNALNSELNLLRLLEVALGDTSWRVVLHYRRRNAPSPSAWLVSQTTLYRGQPNAWQAGAVAPTPPLSAAPGLSSRRLATADDETLFILRAHLSTRKIIRCRGLQRQNVCCTHRRRRAGELFYRSREENPRTRRLRGARFHLRWARCRG